MKKELQNAVRLLLAHSWKDINYDYDGLTDAEKGCVSRDSFKELVRWVKGEKKVTRYPSWVLIAFLMDRREEYEPSSGLYALFDELIERFADGEHHVAWRHGELDGLKAAALRCLRRKGTT